jgi:signal transduction histidine kinase
MTYPEAPEPARVLFGAAMYESALEGTLESAFESTALLPAALTGATPNAELFSCAVLDAANKPLFRSGEPFDPEFVGTDTLGAQYAGLHTEVRVRPELARTLVIGGFPRSRLPLVFGLMALTGGLVFAAIFQLRREGELARLRADFVSGVSHELRTPLAQIRMFAETLALERVRSDEERSRSVDIIVNEAQRLSHQVDNVLLFSRSERGRMRLDRSPTDLSTILDEVLEGFAPLAHAAGVQVVQESGGSIQAELDGDAIRQVLLNLLDNAVKYGPPGQTVTVGAARAPGGQAIVWVEDEGDGVPSDDAKDIFEPYSRLERHRDSAVAGSGIGLAVAREIVRGHGGDIWVETARGGGARFVLRLPCEALPEGASA